ncbi:thioredoxin family protein [Trinickia sp.]|uniref:thioredoxin family protein n=1 Tax=Trinickia sp. TaxID=2571163 RepID=UPI003F8022FC
MRIPATPLSIIAASILVAATAGPVLVEAAPSGRTTTAQGTAPEFTGIDHWLNSPPLTMQSLRGKVVLVDFWTYGCINCFHTLPHVEAWDQQYRSKGLTIIGVHTPEFPNERNTENVKEAIRRYGIRFPVAQDNDYATWNAYGNQYWPAFYLIDKTGHVVYTHVGEGQYEQTQAWIEKLLAQ